MSDKRENSGAPAVRLSPLGGILQPGRYGAGGDSAAGVRLGIRHPLSMVTLIARKNKAGAVSDMMEKHFGVACPEAGRSASGARLVLHWAGAEQWFAVADDREEGVLYEELRGALAGLASLSEQSHGRIVLSVSGPHARDVLAKGTPVDLHVRAFGEGRSAVTQMAHVGVHIAQVGPDDFELSLFRGFAESFWEWLTEMSEEFGYQVV